MSVRVCVCVVFMNVFSSSARSLCMCVCASVLFSLMFSLAAHDLCACACVRVCCFY